ncbi:efflux RND transporter periplasmic adaptor subunit [Terracidiphilus sp.]|jgi:RND family efflux transporter MFP subunit|uniref:efflux RND transporter periplasmic adaptor subunit n=1 Tax=Terracidiphilus sp. TaxID=1964191 RepID=UPI003C20D5FC
MTNEENSKPRNDVQKKNGAQAVHNDESAPDHAGVSGRGTLITVGVLLVVVAVLAVYGIWKRHRTSEVLADTTNELAAPTVIALPAKPGATVDSYVLPGNVTAFSDSPIFARTSGYLTKWYYDIGAPVKAGALLAEIATPELDQQLAQTEADLVTAQSSASNARVQAERYKGLVTSDAVSRLDTDTFVTQEATTSSAVKSAQANVQRLKELQSFEKVYAPFDGVVTARSVDVGQLITQGSTAELFHIQAVRTLRVYTNVPQVYTPGIEKGQKIDLTFPEHPGKTFQGTLVRTADAIDPVNRTLLVEVDVDNRNGELTSGSLAQVHLKTPAQGQTFIVPAAALIFRREGMRVGTVVHGDVAHLAPVTIGEDDGATVQIVAGLNADDKIIQDPPDSLIEGEKVRPQSSPDQNSSSPGAPNQKGGGK